SAVVVVLRTAPVARLVATTSVFAAGPVSVLTSPRRFELADWPNAVGAPAIRQLATAAASSLRCGPRAPEPSTWVAFCRRPAPAALEVRCRDIFPPPRPADPHEVRLYDIDLRPKKLEFKGKFAFSDIDVWRRADAPARTP